MFLELLHHLIPQLMLAATVAVGLSNGEALVEGGGTGGDSNTEGGGEGGGQATEETPEGTEGTEESVEGEGEPEPQEKPEKVDWRTVPPEVKSHIQEIQKTNPKLANLIQNAVYTSSNFLKEMPGGIKEVRALKTTIEEFGGINEIRTMKQTHQNLVEEQESLDNRARSGDPQVLDSLVEVAGDGFPKLMPTAMTKWATLDRPGYNHEISKLFVQSMREGGMVSDLNLAFRMLKLGTPEAVKEATECLNRCAAWANGINDIAVKVPEKPKVDPQIEKQQQDIASERTKLFNDQFSSSFGAWRNGKIREQISSVSNGRQLNDYQMQTLGTRVVDDIKNILTADHEYVKNLTRLYDARDMDALQKFTRARTEKLLPDVVKKAYRALFSTAVPTKKPAPKPGQQPVTPQNTTVIKGWVKVSPEKAPAPAEIDDRKTPFEMKFKKQAILKNGQKVYWGDKVPKE